LTARFQQVHGGELEFFVERHTGKKKNLEEEEEKQDKVNPSTVKVGDEIDDPFYGGVDWEGLARKGDA
jgi:hypothetical protein